MKLHLMGSLRALLFVTGVVAIPSLAAAQATPAGSAPPTPSSFDIYGSYAYLHPFYSDLYGQNYDPIPAGAIAGITGYFKPSWGTRGRVHQVLQQP